MGSEIEKHLNSYYKRRYEDALTFYEQEGPAWEDLTDEQRENVRQECIRHQQEMDDFGSAPF